ncbi:hypothetical protein ACWE42_17530 [Sutcliffiella cohnii]|uniref:Uncharacterized protein n=1 Tax=Sutcliffiella cohnii TaxID=33932 RepID=A0A223KUQ2_9BACI|nr:MULTISPECIES: hypothetical protein [Sutcliffiella]AST93063.1 hypothetical protein BC6307_18265 [Sutcliffiella cohnii]MED4016765.1 hypothetical protein [Sutcliffiella cohnii]WBL14266.1 hypothetical protein O1A01_20645 [Sutcliffiella sp. NC1]
MEIYFSPELSKEEAQVLNIVNQQDKAVGYLSYIMKEKKIYVFGHLEVEGVEEDFKDLVKPYLKGIEKLTEEAEVFSHLSVGGKTLNLDEEEEEK